MTKEDLKDKETFYGYQANIAMAFYDEFRRFRRHYKTLKDIRFIANEAAKNFLNDILKGD